MRPTRTPQQMEPRLQIPVRMQREPQQRVADQGQPLPYQVQQVPQFWWVQQQPNSWKLMWAPSQNLQQQPTMALPPPVSSPPPPALRPCAASGATAASAAALGGFRPSTQGENDDLVDGSESEDNPEPGPPPWKKQNVQMYGTNDHHMLLAKTNLWQCNKDLRGVLSSLLLPSTTHFVARIAEV